MPTRFDQFRRQLVRDALEGHYYVENDVEVPATAVGQRDRPRSARGGRSRRRDAWPYRIPTLNPARGSTRKRIMTRFAAGAGAGNLRANRECDGCLFRMLLDGP
jgi:hypothetical protein